MEDWRRYQGSSPLSLLPITCGWIPSPVNLLLHCNSRSLLEAVEFSFKFFQHSEPSAPTNWNLSSRLGSHLHRPLLLAPRQEHLSSSSHLQKNEFQCLLLSLLLLHLCSFLMLSYLTIIYTCVTVHYTGFSLLK